jgi:hypothetical protein
MIHHATDHEQHAAAPTTPADDFAKRLAASKFDTGPIQNSAEVGAFIADNLDDALIEIGHCLLRHISGDWGDLDDEDKQANDQALVLGARIISAYHLPSFNRLKIWIITEAANSHGERYCTTILFPSEY